MKAAWSLLFLCASLSVVAADENFGKFSEYPQGEFILQDPRPVFRLTKDFAFEDQNGVRWVVPKGESVDGASIPKPAWSYIGGPFEGRYLYASIIHDYFSCMKSKDFDGTQEVFWEAMRAMGVDSDKAWYMWAAVRFLGLPRWDPASVPAPATPCRAPDSQTATIFDQLGDADKTKAVAKLTAIERTLETSKGKVMDVVDGHIVESGSAESVKHIDALRDAAQSGFANRAALGLVTIPTEAEAANPKLVAPWAPGDVVELDRYLQQNSLPADYAAVKQEKFEMKDIEALVPRLQTLDLQKIYEMK